MTPLLIPALIIFLGLFADRFAGGGFWWDTKLAFDHGGPLHGRPVAYATVILAVGLALVTMNWKVAAFALAFALWRWPGWKINDKGGITPTTREDALWTFIRHLLIVGVVPVAYLLHSNWVLALGLVPVFAAKATLLAWWNGKEEGRVNWLVESLRGAVLGLMIWAILPVS